MEFGLNFVVLVLMNCSLVLIQVVEFARARDSSFCRLTREGKGADTRSNMSAHSGASIHPPGFSA